jgi:hypothetical protein
MPTRSARSDEPLAEYDLSKGVRGKYYERLQLFLHRHQVERAPASIRVKGHEDAHVAVSAEMLTERGVEKRELANSPSSAEVGELPARHEVFDRDFARIAKFSGNRPRCERQATFARGASLRANIRSTTGETAEDE